MDGPGGLIAARRGSTDQPIPGTDLVKWMLNGARFTPPAHGITARSGELASPSDEGQDHGQRYRLILRGGAAMTWTPTPEQRDALNRARERACELRDGGAALTLIAFTLTIEGYPTVRGGPWSISSVSRLIKNPPLPEASVSYGARHARVRAARGKAREYPCTECGKQAQVWAQIHGTDGMDLMDYQPMCQKCHLAYDGIPGSVRSAETRAKMSAYASNRTPEHRARMIEAHRGVKRTGQALENIRRAQQERRRREAEAGGAAETA